MEKSLEASLTGCRNWMEQSLRESPEGWTVLTKLIKNRDLVPTSAFILVEGGFNKGVVVPASASVSGESCPDPPTLTSKLVYSAPLCVSPVLFKLLTQCWSSERVSSWASKFCTDPSGRMPRIPAALWLTQMQTPLCSQLYVMGTFLPGTGAPGWRAWCGTGSRRFSGRTSAAKTSFLIFFLPPSSLSPDS